MRILKNILFQFVFLFTVLFCVESCVYTDSVSNQIDIEYTSEAGSVDGSFASDNDPADNDQINTILEFDSMVNFISKLPIIKTVFLFQDFSRSSWQPPKY